MAKIDVLDILRAKRKTPLEFNFDNIWIPPMYVYLSPQDIESLRRIATSLKLSSKIELKYKMIDDIMRNRGFKRFSAGTNRVVYSFLEDPRFVVKIAVDRVGMQDNPLEYKNQEFLKPYCAKMFYISPCGTVGFAERVLPIKNRDEFRQIASDVFDILVNKILGKYVMEDIGTKYFMNYGIRVSDGPVLLDYPFLYKLDGKKLFCTKVDPFTNEPCNGEIDYDAGFNHLVCTRCGKIYLATDLRDNSIDNKIIIKGGDQMKVVLKEGDKVVSSSLAVDDVMTRPKKKSTPKSMVVKTSIEIEEEKRIKIDEERKRAEARASLTPTSTKEVATENSNVETKSEGTQATDVEPAKFNTDSTFIPSDTNSTEDLSISEKEAETHQIQIDNNESTNSVTVINSDEEDSNKNLDSDNVSDEEILGKFDQFASEFDDGQNRRQPIRNKKKTLERDANGRFVSSGNGKKKTNRIPSNKQ